MRKGAVFRGSFSVCSIVARQQAWRSYHARGPGRALLWQNGERPEKARELEIVALSYHS